MALLPTQDKELQESIRQFLDKKFNDWDESNCQDCHNRDYATCSINGQATESVGSCPQMDESLISISSALASLIEKLGYSKGLPDSISEALNSGDGTYRP